MSHSSAVKCYSVVLAAQVMEGKEGGFSIFNLIDALAIPSVMLGLPGSFEGVSSWMFDSESAGATIEVCVSSLSIDGNERVDSTPSQFKLEPSPGTKLNEPFRARMRARGFLLPRTFGQHALWMRWRPIGDDEWRDSDAYWLLALSEFTGTPPMFGIPVPMVVATPAKQA
ncbi:MAG: hypothetical protein WA777_11240 [Rhodanobacter sp.]